jgi:RNA polymerase sigma-70 factor (ECF subfamily)
MMLDNSGKRWRVGGTSVEAIEAIYQQRLDEFCSVVAAITRDRAGALDVVHEAFVSALRSRASFAARGSLSAWLWRIVVNAARDHQRQTGSQSAEWHDRHAAARNEGFHEGLGDVAVAIQALPERQRIAVFLRYYADLDYQQIGEVLGIATGTVSATLSAAHRTLHTQLDEVPR